MSFIHCKNKLDFCNINKTLKNHSNRISLTLLSFVYSWFRSIRQNTQTWQRGLQTGVTGSCLWTCSLKCLSWMPTTESHEHDFTTIKHMSNIVPHCSYKSTLWFHYFFLIYFLWCRLQFPCCAHKMFLIILTLSKFVKRCNTFIILPCEVLCWGNGEADSVWAASVSTEKPSTCQQSLSQPQYRNSRPTTSTQTLGSTGNKRSDEYSSSHIWMHR